MPSFFAGLNFIFCTVFVALCSNFGQSPFSTVLTSVARTSRCLILHEDTLTGGVGAEISAWINEHLFQYLDAPVMRVAGLDTPIPFAPTLEKNFLPQERLTQKIVEVLAY